MNKKSNNAASRLVSYHAASVREYLAWWRDPAGRRKAGMSDAECAASLCEHIGLLWRYTGDQAIGDTLGAFPAGERRVIALAACAWIASANLPDRARTLVKHDALDAGELDQACDIIVRRDALEVAYSIARKTANELPDEDREVLHAFTVARCRLGEIDDVFFARPDIAGVASRIMEPLKAFAKTGLDEKRYWWFFAARAWDAEDARVLNDPAFLARLFSVSSGFFRQEKKRQNLPEHAASLISIKPYRQTMQTALQSAAPIYAAAAAELGRRFSRVIIWKDSVEEFIHAVKQRKLAKVVPSAQSIHAEVVNSPAPNPDNPALAWAQWKIKGVPPKLFEGWSVRIMDLNLGKEIAHARLARGNVVAIADGCWADFKDLGDDTENILLLIHNHADSLAR